MRRRLLVLAMSFILVFTMMPMMSGAAFAVDEVDPPAEDTRIPVTEFEIQFNSNSHPYYQTLFAEPVLGAYVPVDSFCKLTEYDGLVKGEPAYFERVTWQRKKEDGTWERLSTNENNIDTFIEGTYRLSGYVLIKRDTSKPISEWDFNFYRIDPECTVKINGEFWNTGESDETWLPNETSLFAWSKEYVLEDDGTLPLNAYNFELNYDDQYLSVGKAIQEVNIYNKAVFGKKPYTFEKIDGPSWINVSSEGVVSGTPDVQNPNTSTLTVRVTDSNDPAQTKEITCPIGTVGPRLEDRIKVHEVVINHEMFNRVPLCNDEPDVRFLDPQADEDGTYDNPACLRMIGWQGNWNLGWYEQFEVGMNYRTSCRLCIYSDLARYDKNDNKMNAQTHVLADDCKLIVNGVEWEKTSDVVDKTDGQPQSYMSFRSPTAVRVTHTPSAPPTSEVVTKKATTAEDGILTKTYQSCTVCGEENYVQEDVIPKVSSFKLSTTSYTYNGSAKTPTVTVKDANGTPLVKGTDYEVTYENNKNIGTATATVTGKGKYSFTKKLTFTIKARDLASTSKVYVSLCGYDDVKVSWNSVSGAGGYYVYYKKSTSKSYTYAGKTTSTSYKLYNFTDGAKYTFRVYPCVKDGTGKYYKDGSYRTSSEIYMLKKVSSVKAVRSGTKVKVSWSNISGESGYQISRSTKKTGTNIVKTYSTTSGKYYKVSATKGKTYYYKVRAYKTVNGTRIYAPWSTVYKYRR